MTSQTHENPQSDSPRQAGHECGGERVRAIWWGLAGLVLLLAACLATTSLLYALLWQPGSPDVPVTTLPGTAGSAALSIEQPRQLQQLRAAEDEVLQSYGWVDQQQGLARIPIDRAMQLLVRSGLPLPGTAPVDVPSSPDSNGAKVPQP